MNKQRLVINDLPTIDELQSRFKVREESLIGKVRESPEKIMKLRTARAYQFIFENFLMMERQDKELVNNAAKKVVQYSTFGLIGAVFLNIGLAGITKNRIFSLPWPVRFGVRSSIFMFPFFFITDYSFATYTRITMYLTDKYLERSERFVQIGDPKILNPFRDEEEED